MQDYWQKQTSDKPLFPDLIWSRPENRAHAGKLLIIGGNAYGFAAPAEAVGYATKAGIGTARVLLPEKVRKMLPPSLMEVEYAPATSSGSFARKGLAEFLDAASWADGVLLAGDFGRNSETAIVLEQFSSKCSGQLTITQDAADYFTKTPQVLGRKNTLLVLSFAQLQKLAASAGFTTAFTFEMDFLRLVEALHNFTAQYPAGLITRHLDNSFVAVDGRVSTTKLSGNKKIWRVETAAHAAVWWLQNPSKPFEALTTAVVDV